MQIKDLIEIITKFKDVPYVRVLKLVRIYACVLLIIAWLCANVTTTPSILLPVDTWYLPHLLVILAPYRAFLHVFAGKVLLLFVILSLGAPKIKKDSTWAILQTVYDFVELMITFYFTLYTVNSCLEFVYGLGVPDTRAFFISLLYLLICIFKRRYNANTRIYTTVSKQYPLRRSTGCVDSKGVEIYEGDTLQINSRLYTVVRLTKDGKYYACRDGIKVLVISDSYCANTLQDAFPLEDVVGETSITIRDNDKESEKPA